jgi:SsrA-binding protein
MLPIPGQSGGVEPTVSSKSASNPREPLIENRKARHDYFIDDTLEVGLKLLGTEIKSVRLGLVSLGEGYVRASGGEGTGERPSLVLHGVHIGEYPPAGAARQHIPTRERTLLAHKREIRKLAQKTATRGFTLVPLKLYFVRGRAKLLIGLARGKQKGDKRQSIAEREHKRDMDRAMSRRR